MLTASEGHIKTRTQENNALRGNTVENFKSVSMFCNKYDVMIHKLRELLLRVIIMHSFHSTISLQNIQQI